MKHFIMVILMVFVLTSCSWKEGLISYFNENQGALYDAGISCAANPPDDFAVLMGYQLLRSVENEMNAHKMIIEIRCDNKAFSVICDPTKKPEEGPCSNIEKWMKENKQEVPVAWR